MKTDKIPERSEEGTDIAKEFMIKKYCNSPEHFDKAMLNPLFKEEYKILTAFAHEYRNQIPEGDAIAFGNWLNKIDAMAIRGSLWEVGDKEFTKDTYTTSELYNIYLSSLFCKSENTKQK